MGREKPHEGPHFTDELDVERLGTRAIQFDVCGWCETREAVMFVHGELLVLCDTCVDRAAQDML